MSEKEKQAIERLKERITDNQEKTLQIFLEQDIEALQTVLQELKDKDNKIKELEADLYSANCTINEYIEERNKLKDKMIGDRMEQFDDYVIYLIESYLEIMEE